MGQTLSEPVVDKHTAHGEDDRLAWGVSEMQGWRLTMEDSHAHILSLGEQTDGKKTSFFAVYDGHGGSSVARFAGDTLHHRLAANEFFKRNDFEASLKRAFLETDEDLRANPDFRGDPSGCTAVAAIITSDLTIICANAGDSRSVMSLGGQAKPLSFDHKPTNQEENSRIVAAGGFVEFGRVNGNLALSRALGDFEFKQNGNLDAEHQVVTADPDVTVHRATGEDEFVVIACDGIWDVLSSQQVVDFVRLSVAERKPLPAICEDLMDRCLAPDSDWGGVGCDNMTVLVVALKGGRTLDGWYDWVADRVAKGVPYKTPNEYIDPFSQGPRGALPAPGGAGAGVSGGPAKAGPGGVPQSVALAFGGAGGGGGGGGSAGGEPGPLSAFHAALKAQGITFETVHDSDDDEAMEDDAEEDDAEEEEGKGAVQGPAEPKDAAEPAQAGEPPVG